MNDYYDTRLKSARLDVLRSQPGFSFHRLDLQDMATVAKVFKQNAPDCVIHLAAQPGVRYSLQNPAAYGDSNLTGFLNILEACRHFRPRHLVFASSSSVYGLGSAVPYSVEQNTDHPISLYAATKKANEVMAHSYSHLFSIPVTGLRFFTVYGPWGRPDMAVYSFTEAIKAGRSIRIFNKGDLRRDFTYIDDIVDGVIGVAEGAPPKSGTRDTGGAQTAPFRLYNIGNNNPVPLPELISGLEDLIGRKAICEYVEMQPGDVYETYADIDPIMRDYGFQPKTDLRAGLARFVEWHDAYTAALEQA
jgi:UDP-glucuronate 4-epimerase